MPTPSAGYRLANGSKVPGVTTIIGQLGWNKGQLMWWAWNEGKEGRNFRDTSQKAADVGTVAHAMVEAEVHGVEFDPSGFDPALIPLAQPALDAYRKWAEQVSLQILETEVQLVSEVYGFGGTPDAIGYVSGELHLLDFKTSKAVYADYLLQLAAYKRLWAENRPGQPLSDGAFLLRIGKDGGFAYHYYTQATIEKAWEAFQHSLALYELHKPLKGAA